MFTLCYNTDLEEKVVSLEHEVKNYQERELATAAEGMVFITGMEHGTC